jgi:hypothetical protein
MIDRERKLIEGLSDKKTAPIILPAPSRPEPPLCPLLQREALSLVEETRSQEV